MEPVTNSVVEVVGRTFLKKKHYLGEKDKETLYSVQECSPDEFSTCKFLLLYFSAGWCPPCEQFTQVLKDFYNEVNLENKIATSDGQTESAKVIEVIYVSFDNTETEFKETYAKMPWMTFRYEGKGQGMHKKL